MPVDDSDRYYRRALKLGVVTSRAQWEALESARARLLCSGAMVVARDHEPVVGHVCGLPITGGQQCP